MKKTLVLLLLIIPLIAGCSANSEESIAEKSEFGMNFKQLDHENQTASFEINGFANEEEFAQVETIITDSMKKEETSGEYTVSVYASAQSDKEDPVYGTVKYKDGKLSDNKLKNISREEYITLTTDVTTEEADKKEETDKKE